MTKQQVAFARRDQVEKMNKLYRAHGEAEPYADPRGAVGYCRRRAGRVCLSGPLTAVGAAVGALVWVAVGALVWVVMR